MSILTVFENNFYIEKWKRSFSDLSYFFKKGVQNEKSNIRGNKAI
jgi:hypothetical protein